MTSCLAAALNEQKLGSHCGDRGSHAVLSCLPMSVKERKRPQYMIPVRLKSIQYSFVEYYIFLNILFGNDTLQQFSIGSVALQDITSA